jgi:hypothetical protein
LIGENEEGEKGGERKWRMFGMGPAKVTEDMKREKERQQREEFALRAAADKLLGQFYRWAGSTQSLLYDPALMQTVNLCLKKMLFHLLYGFTKDGAKIVYASCNRIIINTQKENVKEATALMNLIKTRLKGNELFSMVNFSDPTYWKVLLLDISTSYSSSSQSGVVKRIFGEFGRIEEIAVEKEKSTSSSSTSPHSLSTSSSTSLSSPSSSSSSSPSSSGQQKRDWEVQFQRDLMRYLPIALRKLFAVLLGQCLVFCLD